MKTFRLSPQAQDRYAQARERRWGTLTPPPPAHLCRPQYSWLFCLATLPDSHPSHITALKNTQAAVVTQVQAELIPHATDARGLAASRSPLPPGFSVLFVW